MRKHVSVLGLAARGAVGRILLITVLTAALAGALLYLVPFVLLFLGYAIGSALGWGEGGCVLIGFAFFALGEACNVIYQRRKKASPITFEIIQVLET